jgi:hypothetical protein
VGGESIQEMRRDERTEGSQRVIKTGGEAKLWQDDDRWSQHRRKAIMLCDRNSATENPLLQACVCVQYATSALNFCRKRLEIL